MMRSNTCITKRKRFALFAALVSLSVFVSCENEIIKEWYKTDNVWTMGISSYGFTEPPAAGVIEGTNAGTEDDPIVIHVQIPYASTIPDNDSKISIEWTGVNLEWKNWKATGSGFPFNRTYIVTGKDNSKRFYLVKVTMGDLYAVEGSGELAPFLWEPMNGLIEENDNAKAGSIMGIFSDPVNGVAPFIYTLAGDSLHSDKVDVQQLGDGTWVVKSKIDMKASTVYMLKVTITDNIERTYTGSVGFTVKPAGTLNDPPTDFNFTRKDDLWIYTNNGDLAGIFTQPLDGKGTAPFSYRLVSGAGSEDNNVFAITNSSSKLYVDSTLTAEKNPYRIRVELRDATGATCTKSFEFMVGIGKVRISNHPAGTPKLAATVYNGNLTAATFQTPPLALQAAGSASIQSGAADIMIYGSTRMKTAVEAGGTYSIMIDNITSSKLKGYFTEVNFAGDIAEVRWQNIWHTFTDAGEWNSFMETPDSPTNNSVPYNIAMADIDMTNDLSWGGGYELYSKMKNPYTYKFDLRGCTGDSFTSNASHNFPAKIQAVWLPDGLKTLDNNAFSGCTSLTDITIPAGMETIGSNVFYGCTYLTKADFAPASNSLKEIGNFAFYNCTALNTINLSASTKLQTIGDSAFYNCTGLHEAVSLTNSAAQFTSIGGSAFMKSGITSISLSGCTNFGGTIQVSTFRECGYLLTATLNNTVTSIGAYSFYGDGALGTASFIPAGSSLKNIGDSAFYNCTNLNTVNLSACSNLETIGASAFYNCTGLTEAVSLTNSAAKISSIGDSAFMYSGVVQADFTGCTLLNEIKNRTFYACANLSTVKFNNCSNLKKIGANAFATSGIQNVDFTGTVLEELGSNSFYKTLSLGVVDLRPVGSTLITIGGSAFLESVIPSINLSNSSALTKIEDSAFRGTTNLSSINFIGCNSLNSLGGSAFMNSAIQTIDLTPVKTTLSSIAVSAFRGSSITKADLAGCDKLQTINDYTFAECPNEISVIDLKNCSGITSIGGSAFTGSSQLKKVDLTNCSELRTINPLTFSVKSRTLEGGNVSGAYPAGLTGLEEVIFAGCTKLKSIGTRAFSETNITSLDFSYCTILDTIGDGSFGYSKLETITLNSVLENIGEQAFTSCEKLMAIDLPAALKKIGNEAFYNCPELTSITIRVPGTASIMAEARSFTAVRNDFYLHVPNGKETDYETYWRNHPLWTLPISGHIIAIP